MKLKYLAVGLALMGLGVGAAAAQSPADFFANADPAKGGRVFNKCKACHTIEEGGPARVGPNLWGLIGRPVASKEDYSYSDAMVAFGGVWTVDRIFTYLAKPREVVKGTNMAFAGLPKPDDRANLIAYLNQNSSSPVDLVAAASEGGAAPEGQ